MAVAPPGGRYDLFALAERIASLSEGDRPAFRMNVGHDDHLLEANRQLRDRFDEVGLPYEYAEVEGGHHWQYVSAQLPEAVDYLVEHLDFGS